MNRLTVSLIGLQVRPFSCFGEYKIKELRHVSWPLGEMENPGYLG